MQSPKERAIISPPTPTLPHISYTPPTPLHRCHRRLTRKAPSQVPCRHSAPPPNTQPLRHEPPGLDTLKACFKAGFEATLYIEGTPAIIAFSFSHSAPDYPTLEFFNRCKTLHIIERHDVFVYQVQKERLKDMRFKDCFLLRVDDVPKLTGTPPSVLTGIVKHALEAASLSCDDNSVKHLVDRLDNLIIAHRRKDKRTTATKQLDSSTGALW